MSLKDSHVLSVCLALSALPPRFIEDLRSQEATEGTMATLRCQMSKAAPVEWRKGSKTLRDGDRYSLRQDGAMCELQICDLAVEDTGDYSCVCGQEKTSATLSVKGKDNVWPPEPDTCCFIAMFVLHM
jgi:obscurin-RhoGEF protein